MSKARRILALLLTVLLALTLLSACDRGPQESDPSASSEDAPYSLSPAVGEDEKIVFRDKALEAAVREQMELPEKYDITPRHCAMVTRLDLRGKGIRDIDGLQYFASMEVLYLGDNEVVHLDALRDLTNLFSLDVSHNRVKDVSPLLGLFNLMFLDVAGNPMENYEALYAFDEDHTYLCNYDATVPWEY